LSTRKGYLLSLTNVSRRRPLRLPREVLEAAFYVVVEPTLLYHVTCFDGQGVDSYRRLCLYGRSVFDQGLSVSGGYHSLQLITSSSPLGVQELITGAIWKNYQFLSQSTRW
jgi:hypothetical protein